MSFRNGRTHIFHADATALGGHIERPFVKDIPVQAPTSLAPAGGTTEIHTSEFKFDDVLSARATHTRVEGHFLHGLATTRMTAMVEDLNVLDRVRTEELVAYISTEHPGQEPDVPRVDFGKTRIVNLRVDDAVLKVHLNLKLLNNGNGDRFPEQAPVFDRGFWKKVGQEFDEKKGFLPCTLVDKIEVTQGKLPGKLVPPNIIEITDFGRVHLAELLIRCHSYQLIMMRFELGCPTQGAASASSGKVNGGTK